MFLQSLGEDKKLFHNETYGFLVRGDDKNQPQMLQLAKAQHLDVDSNS